MKPRKSKRKPLPERMAAPWPVVILAIDPGAASGWALYERGELAEYGLVRKAPERTSVVLHAGIAADVASLPLVIVRESATHFQAFKQAIGMGASWGRWLEALELAALERRPVLDVQAPVWRRAIFGEQYEQGRSRDEWKALAIDRANGIAGDAVNDDTAEAILIGEWAAFAPELGAVIGKRELKRAQERVQIGG